MLRIRLQRTGRRKRPSYRIVVIDQRKPRDGEAKEIVGFYNPLNEHDRLEISARRVRRWLDQGAKPSDTVRRLLVDKGIIDLEGRSITSGSLSESPDRSLELAMASFIERSLSDLEWTPGDLSVLAKRFSQFTSDWSRALDESMEEADRIENEYAEWIRWFAARNLPDGLEGEVSNG